jgi:predicted acetyltransferase
VEHVFREYDKERDREAACRIWLEVGWIDKDQTGVVDTIAEAGRAWVAEVNGAAECMVLTAPGSLRYLQEDLPFFGVTGVTTSRIARKQGLASRLTARAVAAAAADGALVGGLSMFEQGYYNQIGFGTGSYERWIGFDPARLRIPIRPRIPERLAAEDWEAIHAARLARQRVHGACNLDPAAITRSEFMWMKNAFGFGYYDGAAEGETPRRLSHHILLNTREVESGPYTIQWMSYQTYEQFLELMALVRNLGDQVHLVRMNEPSGIQMQDLMEQPFKQQRLSEKSKHDIRTHTSAYWQMRICDLVGCLARTHLRCADLRFNLALSDPIDRYLDADAPWRGVSGEYVVSLGRNSGLEVGRDASLPTLTASVNAFTRLWLGVLSATSLSVTDDLSGPQELLEELDWAFRLPVPHPDWEF